MQSDVIHQARAALEAERAVLHERLKDVEDALGKIHDGTYGYCEQCKGHIAEQRLADAPTARLCDDCDHSNATVLTAKADVE